MADRSASWRSQSLSQNDRREYFARACASTSRIGLTIRNRENGLCTARESQSLEDGKVIATDRQHAGYYRAGKAALDWKIKGRLKDELYKENIVLRHEIGSTSMFEEVLGTSSALQNVLALAAKVAPTDSTVLIAGETGTGKELIARAIHKRSKRGERSFVGVNCAAIPSSLIMSELFGHEKGAFTGSGAAAAWPV